MDKGDVVQLNSGGPHMTVISIDDDAAFCVWFNAKGESLQREFPLYTLKKVPPKPGPMTGGITRSSVY
jgi:uncharacterized protein YodC (DUF2158 family)